MRKKAAGYHRGDVTDPAELQKPKGRDLDA